MNESVDPEVSIFGEALALASNERAAYLEKACFGDLELRCRVERLLGVQVEAGTFFEELETVTRPSCAMILEGPGKWIDRYLLVEQIGEGGCGVVYRAQQDEPVQREVALKIIKLGMDTRQVVARFEAERQALAIMDHPNIARVLDAGATESGRPYFVMDLVCGTKITDFCDQHQLSIPERLDLFIQVCHAIQHAHQKGVIHRDIKPSNILVSSRDGAAFPKVIDFGIAKAAQGRLTNRTLFTAIEQFMGTPAYMSPEQAVRDGKDIDTRSDIYSLGVLLYELLTGLTPFDPGTLLSVGMDEMCRTIREKEPLRPSVRLGKFSAEELASAAQRRHMDGPKLIGALRGDLDWIVMKCLEKERAQRYETVNGLARDIERHLMNDTVVARPPSRMDRIQKMVRRNKLAVAAGAAVWGALVLGFSVSTWLFFREKEARRVAQEAEQKQARLRIQAEKEALKSRALAQSLQDLLQRFGVALTRDRSELKQMLDRLAVADSTEVNNAAILRVRAQLRGYAGLFADADADLNRLLQLTPDDALVWHWKTATLVYARQTEAYRKHCQESLRRFKATRDPDAAERIAKDSLILSVGDVDMNAVETLLSTAANSHSDWVRLAKGLAEYRMGKYHEALDQVRKLTFEKNSAFDTQALLIKAMAAHFSNQPAEAVAAFKSAEMQINKQLPRVTNPEADGPYSGEANGNWADWLFADALLHEAQAVLAEGNLQAPAAK